MVQDAGGVSFDFDGSIDEGCPGEAFWSGTMTMTDADPETLWFSDRPDRLAFTQSTDEFVTGFGETFTESTGGDPNGVLNWEDSEDDTEKHAVLELRYVEGTSPQYDGDASVLTYSVCGLRLDDPDTLEPLPESEQVEPPEEVSSNGKMTLFIDDYAAELAAWAQRYNCFVGGFCSQAAITFPPGWGQYTNAYDGDTPSTLPALGAGCNDYPGNDQWAIGAKYARETKPDYTGPEGWGV